MGAAITPTIHRAAAAFVAATLLLATAAGPAHTQTVRNDIAITNGTVDAMALKGDTLYMGGQFSLLGRPCGAAVPIDRASGAPVAGFPHFAGTVFALAPDGAGGWFVGGSFSSSAIAPHHNLVHVLADNSIAAWWPDPDQPVHSLKPVGAQIFAAGFFTAVFGQHRYGFAAFDLASGALSSWTPALANIWYDMAISDSVLYLGGSGIQAFRRSDGTTLWSLSPGINGGVFALALLGNTLYAGGQFTQFVSLPRNYLAAVNASTGAVTSWAPYATAGVYSMRAGNSQVYAAGEFTSIGGKFHRGIACIDSVTAVADAWTPLLDTFAYGIDIDDSTVYATGAFMLAGTTTRYMAAAFDRVTAAPLAFAPSMNATGHVVVATPDRIALGGEFSAVSCVPRANAAAVDLSTGLGLDWHPDPNDKVNALAIDGGQVLLGGRFTSIGGQPRNRLASVDAATGTLAAWHPSADAEVTSLLLSPYGALVGGSFHVIGGQSRTGLACLDRATGLATAWAPNMVGVGIGMASSDSVLFVGGNFTSIAGVSRPYVAAVSLNSGAALPWNPAGASNTVSALWRDGNTLYIGGSFEAIAGTQREYLAALDATTGALLPWNPAASGPINTVASAGGAVYVGGSYNVVGSASHMYFASVDGTSGAANPWTVDMNGNVFSVLPIGGAVVVGGAFSQANGDPAGGVALAGGMTADVALGPFATGRASTIACSPNPASGMVSLRLSLAQRVRARVRVFDASGRLVASVLHDALLPAGSRDLAFDASRMHPGLYFVRLETPAWTGEAKLVVIR